MGSDVTGLNVSGEVAAAVDRHVERFRAEHGLPSVVAGLVQGDQLVHVAASAEPGQPVPSAATPYRIASMTKSFLAAAVLRLRDGGRLALDDPIGTLVPELAGLRGPTADSPPVTVRRLLTMTGGLAGDDPWADRLLDLDRASLDRLLPAGLRFALSPGSGYTYANLGYTLLGRAVTNRAGRPYQAVVSDELLGPLGMHATTWGPPAGAAAAWWRVDGALVTELVPADGEMAAFGGLWSTVADLARWCGFLLDAFPPRDDPDHPVLGRASRRELQQTAVWQGLRPSDPAASDLLRWYGFGHMVAHHGRLGTMVDHSGGLPGYGSNMRWLPGRGVAAVALANLRYAPVWELTLELLELLADQGALPAERAPAPPPDLPGAADDLVGLLNRWSDEAAADLFSSNVELDETLARRRAAAAERLARHGPLQVRGLTALNRAEADVALVDDRALPLTLSFMLSPGPLGPAGRARIQWYELVDPAPPAPPEPAPPPPGPGGR